MNQITELREENTDNGSELRRIQMPTKRRAMKRGGSEGRRKRGGRRRAGGRKRSGNSRGERMNERNLPKKI